MMARSINGNLMGRAARKDELMAENLIYKVNQFSEEYLSAVDYLRDLMGDEYFESWYDSYPRNMLVADFYKIMLDQIQKLVLGNLDKKDTP